MGQKSWRGQIDYALQVIDQRWTSKHDAKRAHGHRPGQAVPGVFSDGYWNTVFDRAITLTHWITVHYPELRRFDQVDANKDGQVSFDELRAARRHGRHGGHFKRMDTDNDGKVSRAEAMAAAEAAFTGADADGDGFVTAEEMRAAHKARHAKR